MIYEVTSAGHVRRACAQQQTTPCCHLQQQQQGRGSDVVLVNRDFHEVSATHPGSVFFYLHRDIAELMRTWDVALYARVKRSVPRIFETAVCLLMLSDTSDARCIPVEPPPRPQPCPPPQTPPQAPQPPPQATPQPQPQPATNPKEQLRWAIGVLRKYNVESAKC